MSVVAKGPPYFTPTWEMAEPVVYKPSIPEVEERKQEVVWKKVDLQIARDMWLDSQFLDGTTVREALERPELLYTEPDLDDEEDDDDDDDTRSAQVGGTHYSDMKVQPWDAMRAWFTPAEYASYHIGTVIGYLSRHRRKGGLSDIKKAHHHLSELIRYFEEEEEYE